MTINRARTFYFHQSNLLVAKQKGPKRGTSALEKQIGNLVYAPYNLKPKEILIVEGEK